MTTVDPAGDVHARYFELVHQFPLRPIHSDEELDEAVRVVDVLLSQPSLSPEEGDYLDVLSDQVERYETNAHPLPPVSDAALLRHLIEAKGVSQREAAEAVGIPDSTISEVLGGKRSLNRKQIGKLARFFGVSPDVFHF